MAGTLSPTGENRCLNWAFTTSTPVRPTTWYVSLHVGPNSNGTANEIVGNGYARQAVTWSVTGNVMTNSNALTYGPATASWGAVTDICVWDAVTGGNCWAQGVDSATVTYNSGDSATVAISAISLTLT